MGAALLKQQFDSFLGGHLDWQHKPAPELVPSGIPQLDLPRGALTEIVGPASSGRATLLLSILAAATARQEICAVIDAEDEFDPASAAAAGGIDLGRLLWIRCPHNAEHALKAADLLIQGGGFGLIAMDLGDTPVRHARRISLTSWFRLRRAVEHTPTVLVTVALKSNAKTCASLVLECRRERAFWSGAPVSRLLRGMAVRATSTERSLECSRVFTARAI